MDYKDTLLMPSTTFEMRANLNIKEPVILKKWRESGLYQKIVDKNKDRELFMLHDGPPYANGPIHFGHALNKILKDFIIRSKNLLGYYAPMIMGFDVHGLPIEVAVQKKYPKYKELSISEYRKMCAEFALSQVEVQKAQMERLGILADIDHPYITMQKELEALQIKVFSKLALSGAIYKGLKPIYWSPAAQSALAEAEIEYKDIESDSIYVSFEIVSSKNNSLIGKKVIIWTTTPWTLPANLALAFNPRFNYALFSTDRGEYIFLKDLKEKIKEEIQFEKVEFIRDIDVKDLEHSKANHPFINRTSLLVLADYVTSETGTGIVHIAPGHGSDDFNVGMKYQLEVLSPVDQYGKMTAEAGEELVGLTYLKANEKVIEILENNGVLLAKHKINHSYPHDWRYKKPVIFRATPQWFASISQIKSRILEIIKEMNWIPKSGEIRMTNMISERTDWCISRQRTWGVPIPIIYGEDNTPLIDEVLFNNISEIFNREGSNAWFTHDASYFIPKGYSSVHSPNNIYTLETDTMDVWFDSGSTHTSVLKSRGFDTHANLYFEGNDQYRGWFNSSLITSVYLYDRAQTDTVLTHGMIVDEHGQKMSKSLGNGIDPIEICNTYGADVLRILVSLVDYKSDVSIGKTLINLAAENYKKIRNTFRFMLANIAEVKERKLFFELKSLKSADIIDWHIMYTLFELRDKVINAYNEYNFTEVSRLLYTYIVDDLSSFYLDITKDVLYCDSKDSLKRKTIQAVIYNNLLVLLHLYAPIIPFTAEEIFSTLNPSNDSIHLSTDFIEYGVPEIYIPDISEEIYVKIKNLRDDVLMAIEEKRKLGLIKSSLEADITLSIKDYELAEIFSDESSYAKFSKENVYGIFSNEKSSELLKRLFIVSNVTISHVSSELKEYKVSYVNASFSSGKKCERCWGYFDNLDENNLCPRCLAAVNKIKDER